MVKQTMEMIAGEDLPGPLRELRRTRRRPQGARYVKPIKRVFDNAKVSDHFAIIPTLQAPKSLTEIEAKALRHGGQALPRGVLPERRVHGHDRASAR